MKLLDVNVVLAGARDDHPLFPVARPWLVQLWSGDEPFGVPVHVWASTVRLLTNRRVFLVPTSLADAFTYVHAVRSLPNYVELRPGPHHVEHFERLCHAADAVGDLAVDADLAAFAVEHACELVSFDRDFARFSDLRWTIPSDDTSP